MYSRKITGNLVEIVPEGLRVGARIPKWDLGAVTSQDTLMCVKKGMIWEIQGK